MSVAPLLKLVIAVLESFVSRTGTVIDDQTLSLLKAIDASPAMIAWIEQFVPIQAALPEGTLAQSDLTAIPADVKQMISPGQMTQLFQIMQILIQLYREFGPKSPAAPAPTTPSTT